MIQEAKYINFITILIYLIPVSLVAGIAITEILVFLISISFVYYSFQNKNFQYFKSKFFLYFLCTYLFIILNSFLSDDIYLSLKVGIPYLRYGIFALAVCFIYEKNNNFIKNFYYFLIPLILFLLVDSYYQFIFEKNIFGYDTQSSRLSSIFFDEWILGSFLQKFFPFLIIILFTSPLKNKSIVFHLIILFLVYLIIFFSGERSAFYLINFFLLINLYFFLKISKKLRFFLIIVAPILILILSSSQMKERIFFTDKNSKLEDKVINFYNSSYKYFHITSIKIFKNNKIIGSGVKTFRILCDDYFYLDKVKSCSTHPHNYYIQILAETGLIGIFIIISFFLFLIVDYIRLISKDKFLLLENFDKIILTSGLIVYLWPIATTGNFFNNFISIILFFNIGLYLKKNINRKMSKNKL